MSIVCQYLKVCPKQSCYAQLSSHLFAYCNAENYARVIYKGLVCFFLVSGCVHRAICKGSRGEDVICDHSGLLHTTVLYSDVNNLALREWFLLLSQPRPLSYYHGSPTPATGTPPPGKLSVIWN